MNKSKWKTYTFWILLTGAAGLVAGLLTREGTQIYGETIVKPPLSPPAILFPIVWTILYALMGIGAARIALSPPSDARANSLRIYLAQLFFNFGWSIIFFDFQAFGAAFIWLVMLWGLILWMILSYAKVDRTAALLQIPYLLWVTFAGYLNFGVWTLNK